VTDFGLARRLEADSELTRTGTALGSPSYMAPEQARGDAKQLTTAADIYSLGAILYELLTGRPPFKGTNVIETMREVVEKAPERPRLLNPNVDGDLETICLKCLEKEPAHRYASAEALAEDLARWLEGKPIHARPNTAWERTVKFVRRKPAIASLAAVSCIAAAALIGIGLAQVAFRAEQNQRKQTEAALKEATRQHGEAEKQRQVAEGLERLRVEDAQVRLEMQRVDAWLTAEEDDYALAYLAKVAERFPSNALVAERVLDELSKRQMPSVLLGPMGVGSACCFSPDDETMAVRGGPGEVRLINLRSGKPTHDLTLPSQASDPLFIIGQRPCAFSKDGDLLITLDPMLSAQLWNVRTGEPVGASFKLTQPPREIHLLQGGRRLAANAGSECSLWDCASGKRLNAWRFPSQVGGNWTIRFSPDERMMALSSVMYAGTPPTRQLQLIDLENGLSMSTNSLSGQIMEFSPQGDLLAVASATELVFLETPS
jgi:hypothetical protein